MAKFPEPEGDLTFDELEHWREVVANISVIENTSMFGPDDFQRARSYYYEQMTTEADIRVRLNMAPTADVRISPITGAVWYEPLTIEVDE